MARIFISYSRADKSLIERLVKLLRRVRRDDVFWYDGEITGGDDWWALILSEIDACDVFMYLLSNDSVESDYCQAEFREALRLHKICLPVIVRPKTQIGKLPADLGAEISKRHWVNLENGTDDAVALSELYAALGDRIRSIPASTPTPLNPIPMVQPQVTLNVRRPAKANNRMVLGGGIVAVMALIIIALVLIVNNQNGVITPTPEATTQVAMVTGDLLSPTPSETATTSITDTPTNEPTATLTLSPTVTPTPSDTPTQPDPFDVASQLIQTENAGTETQVAVDMTATATQWTLTPTTTPSQTPDGTQTVDAARVILRVQTQSAIETQIALSFTPTNTRTPMPTTTYTPSITPTSTSTPSNTPSITPTSTSTPSNTPSITLTSTSTPSNTPSITPTATLSPLELAIMERAMTRVAQNEAWTPFEQDFDGVTMVLVPAGCFDMGSTDRTAERPIHEQCFDTPFWIDKYEVTNGQFANFGGVAGRNSNWTADDLPRESITWFEARDYCENNRGGRLPTEAEWEYAARGPNNLIYPWGNDFVEYNVVYSENSDAGAGRRTAPVGSREGGVSWVGAMDMSGNVWEWTSSLYVPYPYNQNIESIIDNSNFRVLRGGAWNEYVTTYLRAPYRSGLNPTGVYGHRGFRCVRSL